MAILKVRKSKWYAINSLRLQKVILYSAKINPANKIHFINDEFCTTDANVYKYEYGYYINKYLNMYANCDWKGRIYSISH